jgi:hypothetical protein
MYRVRHSIHFLAYIAYIKEKVKFQKAMTFVTFDYILGYSTLPLLNRVEFSKIHYNFSCRKLPLCARFFINIAFILFINFSLLGHKHF